MPISQRDKSKGPRKAGSSLLTEMLKSFIQSAVDLFTMPVLGKRVVFAGVDKSLPEPTDRCKNPAGETGRKGMASKASSKNQR